MLSNNDYEQVAKGDESIEYRGRIMLEGLRDNLERPGSRMVFIANASTIEAWGIDLQ